MQSPSQAAARGFIYVHMQAFGFVYVPTFSYVHMQAQNMEYGMRYTCLTAAICR